MEHRQSLEDVGGGGGRSGYWNVSSLKERIEDVVVQAKEEVADVPRSGSTWFSFLFLLSKFYFASSI